MVRTRSRRPRSKAELRAIFAKAKRERMADSRRALQSTVRDLKTRAALYAKLAKDAEARHPKTAVAMRRVAKADAELAKALEEEGGIKK